MSRPTNLRRRLALSFARGGHGSWLRGSGRIGRIAVLKSQ